jgi:hypothetical protein
MKKTCPKCGADGNGKPAPKESRFWCSSSAWEDGDFYQSPECVRRERDNLLERVKRLESAGDLLAEWHLALVTTREKAERDVARWNKAKETKP